MRALLHPSCKDARKQPIHVRAVETEEGSVTVLDLMPIHGEGTDVLRTVVGNRGRVPMRMELVIRFGYGSIGPWVQRIDGGIAAIAGPDCLRLHTPVATRGEDLKTVAEFTVGEGEQVPFVLTWWPSHLPAPAPVEPGPALKETEEGWRKWSQRCGLTGPYREMVQRSLMTLKALTYEPTGGIAAAATTSLPEKLGGHAIGTIATAGCATRRSPSTRS
jgi:GH15 family glucan-1,4-alpha-glucosidase